MSGKIGAASHRLPSGRTLLIAWGLLMALTFATMIAGRVTSTASLGLMWSAVLLVVTWAKARTILQIYLNLRSAPKGWQAGFNGILIFLLVVIFAVYAVSALGLIPG